MSETSAGTTHTDFFPNEESFTVRKIKSYRELKEGWHFGEGEEISDDIIQLALQVHGQLIVSGFTYTDSFPGIYGEVQVAAYHQGHFVSIIIEADKTLSFVHELDKNDVETPIENENFDLITTAIKKAASSIWNIYDFSTQNISTRIENASPNWLSKNHQATNAYHWFSEAA